MNRRTFTRQAVAASVAAPLLTVPQKSRQEYYELRTYRIPSAEKRTVVEEYLRNYLLPAYNKQQIKSVGVFTMLDKPDDFSVYVLIPFPSIEKFTTVTQKVSVDTAYVKASQLLETPMKEPAYDRIESSLLVAFDQMPAMKVPEKKDRIFELRRYESHHEQAAKQKVKMFNAGGEIPIFYRTGLIPVFFGETLIGPYRPNLTYLLTFADMAAHDKSWEAFQKDPDWVKLKDVAEYKDTVSHIERTFLAPTSYSQV